MEHAAKILLLGKTGVGKSAFINYFLGKQVAKSAAGLPVTMEYFIPYEIEDGSYPIEIYDTKGLEAIGAYEQLNEIITGVKERNQSEDIFNWFHTIFYCVSMANRFEDFEAEFIRTLQQELTQHIHIILTHCDVCEEDTIRRMRERITGLLGGSDQIEIFEVVCTGKKKRNGTIVLPRGREAISGRVFDLLWEDIAYKVSSDYAYTLRNAMVSVADQTLARADGLIDDVVRLKTLFKFLQDELEADEYLDGTITQLEEQMNEDLERVKRETDQRFTRILRPAAQLYASYRGAVTGDFLEEAQLAFDDCLLWTVGEWMDTIDGNALIAKMFPGMAKKGYIDGDDFVSGDDTSVPELLKMIGTGIADLAGLKKNLKRICRDVHSDFIANLPTMAELQKEAFQKMIEVMR